MPRRFFYFNIVALFVVARSIRRKYIALSGAVVVIVLVILLHIFLPWTDPAVVPTRHIGFTLIIIELLFTVPVYFSKNETTKNMLTTMIWILTTIYVLMFIYLISTMYSPTPAE